MENINQEIQKSIQDKKSFVAQNIISTIQGEETLESLIQKGMEVYTEDTLNEFDIQLRTQFAKGLITEEELEKAVKDRSHLVQKKITDSKGHQRTVWVRPAQKDSVESKKITPNGIMQKKELSKEDLESIKGKEDELSHINKIRFQKEWDKNFGEDTKKTKEEIGKMSLKEMKEDIESRRPGTVNGGKKDKVEDDLSPAAKKHKEAMEAGATEQEADQIARGKRNKNDHSGVKEHKTQNHKYATTDGKFTMELIGDEENGYEIKTNREGTEISTTKLGKVSKQKAEEAIQREVKDALKYDKKNFIEKSLIDLFLEHGEDQNENDELNKSIDFLMYGKEEFKIEKNGKEIKEALSKLRTFEDNKRMKAYTEASNLLSEIDCEPTEEYSVEYYLSDVLANTDFEAPKLFSYRDCYPSVGMDRAVSSSEAQAINDPCANKAKYNQLMRCYVMKTEDIRKIDTVINNINDKSKYSLTINQAAILGF